MDNESDLDALMTDDFLDSLDYAPNTSVTSEVPSWVSDNTVHTTYKAYHAILELKSEAQQAIENFGEVATNKTKKFYQIKKSNVARVVGKSAQSIFNASSFSKEIERFFDEVNRSLLELHAAEQKKQLQRRNKGIRSRKKETIVVSHQCLEKKYNDLQSLKAKEVLDLAVEKMPFDLKAKLGL